ncbi:thioredoxin-like 3-3 [Salvia splendens]|uniref:thioredoxin-like 3-3 n=1 Tax=Salvia splendens TaxID=180675 RepID=UPI001C2763C4|nr:thioredoxin-like 3-3 [Salvia splendens]
MGGCSCNLQFLSFFFSLEIMKEEKLQGMEKEEIQGVAESNSPSNLLKNAKSNLVTATSDDSLKKIFRQIKASRSPTVINYGVGVCSQILPAFCELISKFSKLSFVYADIDECPETTQHIRYTPTFHFYRDGERVDKMFGAGEERLHDRLWLHSWKKTGSFRHEDEHDTKLSCYDRVDVIELDSKL